MRPGKSEIMFSSLSFAIFRHGLWVVCLSALVKFFVFFRLWFQQKALQWICRLHNKRMHQNILLLTCFHEAKLYRNSENINLVTSQSPCGQDWHKKQRKVPFIGSNQLHRKESMCTVCLETNISGLLIHIKFISFFSQVWCLEALEQLDSIRGHENPVCTLVTKRNMLFSGSLKKIKVLTLIE